MKISKKQKMIHVYSMIALVFSVVIFFILGGGRSSEIDSVDGEMLNTTIPLAEGQSISSDRFTALKREDQRLQDQNRMESLQRNSFDLFNMDKDYPTTTSSAQPSGEMGHTVQKVNNTNINSGKSKSACKGGVDSIMRLKRAQLEKELGINLSDYGYDKYESGGTETNYAMEDRVEYEEEEIGGFYGIESANDSFNKDTRAVIHGNHVNLTSGAIVKMRLLDDIEVEGVKIPMNTFVFGKLSFKSGRAVINIQSINYHNKILRFRGAVYDSDGFEGIYVPDNVISDTKDKAVSDAVGSVNLNVSSKSRMVNSAISAFGNAIKGAVSGSLREAKISISSNYLVTIKRRK